MAKTYLDLLRDFSFASPSSIIRLGELDLLSATSALAGLLDLDDEALPDLDLDFLLLGLPLRDRLFAPWDFGLGERDCDRDFGLWDRDLGLCDRDLGLCDLDLGLCERDFGLCAPDFGLPERDRALPEPLLDRDLDLEALGDLEAWDLGLALDLGLVEPDLLL